jgi:CRP-like cAMP-binding protein
MIQSISIRKYLTQATVITYYQRALLSVIADTLFGFRFNAGSEIYLSGEDSSEFYILLSDPFGPQEPCVHIFKNYKGQEIIYTTVSKGGYFGHEAFLNDKVGARTTTAKTYTDAHVACVHPTSFPVWSSFRMTLLIDTRLRLLYEKAEGKQKYFREEERLKDNLSRLRSHIVSWETKIAAEIEYLDQEILRSSLKSASASLSEESLCDGSDEILESIENSLKDLVFSGTLLVDKLESERKRHDNRVDILEEQQRRDFEEEVQRLAFAEKQKKNHRNMKAIGSYLSGLLQMLNIPIDGTGTSSGLVQIPKKSDCRPFTNPALADDKAHIAGKKYEVSMNPVIYFFKYKLRIRLTSNIMYTL